MNVLFNLHGKKELPVIGNTVENSLMALAFQVHVIYVRSKCIEGLIPQSLQLQTKVTLVNLISKFGRVPNSCGVDRCVSAFRTVEAYVAAAIM